MATLKRQYCFLVEVEVINPPKDSGIDFFSIEDGERYKCLDSMCYVIADNLSEVVNLFSGNKIKMIQQIGFGYTRNELKDTIKE